MKDSVSDRCNEVGNYLLFKTLDLRKSTGCSFHLLFTYGRFQQVEDYVILLKVALSTKNQSINHMSGVARVTDERLDL